jgi:DNA-binding MarR family transcriptional regulator
VERGLVERLSSPTDARSVQVRLTETGRDVVDAAMAELIAGEREILAGLDPHAQESLAGLLKSLLEPFDEV